MYEHLGRRPELLGHVFYDFQTSPLKLLVLDRDQNNEGFDPTSNGTVPNMTDPVGPPSDPHEWPVDPIPTPACSQDPFATANKCDGIDCLSNANCASL